MRIIDKDCALEYARKKCTKYVDYTLQRIENDTMLGDAKREALKRMFAVPGYAIVDAYIFHAQDGETYYDYHAFGLFEADTARVFYIYSPRNLAKVGLALFPDDQTNGRLKDFEFGEEHPNYIGKATKKKIDEWIRFVDREDDAKKAYITAANYMNRQFRMRVEKRYPDARMTVLDDGWMTEFYITAGYVVFHYTAGDNGHFYREHKVDISHLPSTDELLPQIENND